MKDQLNYSTVLYQVKLSVPIQFSVKIVISKYSYYSLMRSLDNEDSGNLVHIYIGVRRHNAVI